ncbi:hypothetical protein BTM25_49200 [Actinomadura rubteroloni]|uniref:Leucine-rich repeat domain-containing protein n=1 Tax=Actinomadura rubteroloni TaxID=1926885 RepID=A0A2P4UCE3_9ACTN|nr:STM4015 family protein [Actinomadura rubteroloni]POM22716.1 hypothetical protein BTM25_49200 [Actinomadura rubteroloni]
MNHYDMRTEFAGQIVADFDSGRLPEHGDPAPVTPQEAADLAWRVSDEERFRDVWDAFLDQVDTSRVRALIFGAWGLPGDGEEDYPVPLLAEAADRFPALRSLFLGEIPPEMSEMSWIEQDDITPLLTAFPALERLEVRGGAGLRLEPVRHTALRTLRLESAGLPAGVVRAVAASDLPALEHLDLWLGTANQSGDATPADLAGLLDGARLPALRHLGLEDAEIADDLAAALASAPLVARLESLSLALGALSDRGAEALLTGQPLTHLRKLNLHYHYIGEVLAARLRAALPGTDVDLSRPRNPSVVGDREFRFIAVSE